MHTRANKKQTNQQKTHIQDDTHNKKRSPTFQFVDNRPETLQMKKLLALTENHSQNTPLSFSDNRKEIAQMKRLQELANKYHQQQPIQKKENNTGLPDHLKTGIENLSGYAMDDVKVHYNSDKPAQLNAHAYAQGTDIHLASGQEKHLPHEAWHVVQQKQGRVKPTMQIKGNVNINDEQTLEKEADSMGSKAIAQRAVLKHPTQHGRSSNHQKGPIQLLSASEILQLSSEIKQTIAKAFGESAQEVMKLAPTIAQLQEWTQTMNGHHAAVAKAKDPVDNPVPKGATKAERQALRAAEAARDAYLAGILATQPQNTGAGAAAPAWGASSNMGAAPAPKVSPQTEKEPSAPATLPKPTKVALSYNNHGDYDSKITTSNLKTYVMENHEHFEYRGKVSGGEGYRMYLGPKVDEEWYITVTHRADGSVLVTHFGPFGVKTASKVEKGGGGN